MMFRTITIALVCVALSGCGAGMARLGTYGTRMADAKTEVDGREYSIWLHPTENTVAAQRGFGALVAQRAVEGITLGSASFQEPLPIWRSALEWLLLPAGCSIVSIYELERSSYEAAYQCPAGVDLRALVREHRDTLRDGQPLPPQ
jgi:hypothetical protein